ncbi:MAG: transketolase family protein [Chloroflexi bacterium]|nr:transketolase family protein [Chloroflexota bacterium]
MVTQASTREAYGKTLLELGRENTNIVVIGGDLNKSTMTTFFAKEFPDRFFDCGAAEQNMMSISAGLASSGKIPFVSTFAVFGSGRPFDQIRISIAQARANVKIVVTHAGIITGSDGMSAHGIEDLALMCSLVGFTVVVPADARETAQVIRSVAQMDGPCYVRLSRPATPLICPEGYRFQPGKASVFRPGDDVSILATGIMVAKALEAAETLAVKGLSQAEQTVCWKFKMQGADYLKGKK